MRELSQNEKNIKASHAYLDARKEIDFLYREIHLSRYQDRRNAYIDLLVERAAVVLSLLEEARAQGIAAYLNRLDEEKAIKLEERRKKRAEQANGR